MYSTSHNVEMNVASAPAGSRRVDVRDVTSLRKGYLTASYGHPQRPMLGGVPDSARDRRSWARVGAGKRESAARSGKTAWLCAPPKQQIFTSRL